MTKAELMELAESDYYRALNQVQNLPSYEHQDILTITGFMNHQEKMKHLETNIDYAGIE